MVSSWVRGHLVFWDDRQNWWCYYDTKEPVNDSRPCLKCGRLPTEDGHDACVGYIDDPNIVSVCCGHGKRDGCVIVKTKTKSTYTAKEGQELKAYEISNHDLNQSMTSLDAQRKGETTESRL